MVKQMIFLIPFFISSLLINQELIQTKEFVLFKQYEDQFLDLKEYLDYENSNYKIEVIAINSIENKNTKKTILPQCELDISLYFPKVNKKVLYQPENKNAVSVTVCDQVLTIDNYLHLDKSNSILEIFSKKNIFDSQYEIVFWITGKFKSDNTNPNKKNQGFLREWYDDGSLYIEYQFKNGKKNGTQKKWYLNGQQEILYFYKNGKLNGTQKKWHENGVLKYKINYLNDVQHGKSEEWYSDGTLKHSKIFDNGVMISQVD